MQAIEWKIKSFLHRNYLNYIWILIGFNIWPVIHFVLLDVGHVVVNVARGKISKRHFWTLWVLDNLIEKWSTKSANTHKSKLLYCTSIPVWIRPVTNFVVHVKHDYPMESMCVDFGTRFISADPRALREGRRGGKRCSLDGPTGLQVKKLCSASHEKTFLFVLYELCLLKFVIYI